MNTRPLSRIAQPRTVQYRWRLALNGNSRSRCWNAHVGADELDVRNVPERRPQLVDGPWRDVEKRHAPDAACQAEGRETTARPDLQNVCAGCERQVLAQDLVADRKVM